MILNSIEKAMMNNPIRAYIQRHYEAKKLLSMGGPVKGGRVLEIGCGQGVGAEIIFDLFLANNVEAFDLDPKMVEIAKKRLQNTGKNISVFQGSATKIVAENDSYDAVFDFAIIHHIPNWQDALNEIHRVLKPGKRFYAEEVLKKFIHRPIWRRLLDHPQENRFNHQEFIAALDATGFRVLAESHLYNELGWYVAEKRLA